MVFRPGVPLNTIGTEACDSAVDAMEWEDFIDCTKLGKSSSRSVLDEWTKHD
jgi:hypothetical protein